MNKTFFFWIMLLLGAINVAPSKAYDAKQKKFVVVLDAGHGGGDPGTVHRKYKKDEKVIALDVALRIGKLIEANYKDVKVVYTRRRDTYPSLPERTQIAKKNQGDLFISIHVNAAPDRKAHGFETYIFGITGLKGKNADEQKRIRERMANERENLDIDGNLVDFERDMDIETKILCQAQREKNNIHSEEVAKFVHREIISGLKRSSYKANVQDRGIKEKNIFVLCYSPMPAILVELGYMSNDTEEKFLNSEEAMQTFSKAIFAGFKKYKSTWDKRKLSTEDEETNAPSSADSSNKDNAAASSDNPPKKETNTSDKAVTPQKDSQTSAPAGQKIFYKIQFLSSDHLLKTGDPALKGLEPFSYYKDGKVYRYTFGQADSSAALANDLKKVKKLFPDAFIIKTDEKMNRIR